MRNNAGRGFVAIMIIVALSAVALRFGVLKVIRFTIEQNEANALEKLQFLTTALENFANDHALAYPSDLALLAENDPPYISKEYVSLSPARGYTFNCMRLEPSGYTFSAAPAQCGISGRRIFTVTTGQAVSIEECGVKD